jgi:uncharacterized protein (TIGR03067 family)
MTAGGLIAVLLAAQTAMQRKDPAKVAETERIARLIDVLGDDDFAQREAAENELEVIGEPALAALRRAARVSDDREIRWRAEAVGRTIAAQVSEAVAKSTVAKLQGVWTVAAYEVEGKQIPGLAKESTITITGDMWVAKWAKEGGVQVESGVLKTVSTGTEPLAVNLTHLDGPHKGSTVYAILRVEDDTFKYCYRDRAEDRPADFATRPGDTRCGMVTYKQLKM